MKLGLKSKNALVIASSQGLGKAIAAELVREGANVMLSARNEEKLALVKEQLKHIGTGKVSYCTADITNPSDIKNLTEMTIREFGGINLLVNNAGGPKVGSFSDMSDEDWQNAFELNLLSYIRVIREVLPSLKEEGGKIVNIASSSTKEPIPGLILSNTFRTGIVGLAKSLALELAADRILVNTVSPGRIATERVTQLDKINAMKQGVSEIEIRELAERHIPLGRYGEPEEFAKFVTFLLSDANTYITGQNFLVDGGLVKSI